LQTRPKAYITHPKIKIVGSNALVGSSNFTFPGLTQNAELNVRLELQHQVTLLQEWYERHWNVSDDITPEILRVIERHTREYAPFEVYAKSLAEFFRSHEMTIGEWEKNESRIYSKLDHYQREGYQALMKIAEKHRGAFLCDGVGLGKTFIGMMVIERLVEHDRKRVALFVPKAARKPVWEKTLRRYMPHVSGAFSNLEIFNHTDLYRGGDFQERLAGIKERADVIVVDEAHHFRNPGVKGEGERRPSRYRRFAEIAAGKTLFLLTATPINNSLIDLQHMMELFTERQEDYFRAAPLGIHSLSGHFRKMEKELSRIVLAGEASEIETNQVEAEQVLASDELFNQLVVQRSRAYVKQSQAQQSNGNNSVTMFPQREDPHVAEYSVKKTYGRLLTMIEQAFSKEKPLFSLAIYDPTSFYKGQQNLIDAFVRGRQKQVVALIRTQFLKRFESSAHAFGLSCEMLYRKLLAFAIKHAETPRELAKLERLKNQRAEHEGFIRVTQIGLFVDQLDMGEAEVDEREDIVTDEMLEDVKVLSRSEYRVEDILTETFLDMEQILEFLDELKKFKPSNDDKLRALVKLLKTDPVLKRHKVLIFTEYLATARYLRDQLKEAGITGINEVDGSTSQNERGHIIQRFSPYYNESSSAELAAEGLEETRVLISTDVLSEGLNLQDATRLINYDLHWNPVRLMQRIGRVDRRMNPQIEERMLADHPEYAEIRGTSAYWNFLPPDELNELLKLYERVSHKTLLISRTFGIEGKKLLRPEDDFEALRDFTHAYEGTTTPVEEMHLEYQKLLKENPDLAERIAALPGRVFSGKAHPSPDSKAIFFCYALPAPTAEAREADNSDAHLWTEEAGSTKWYLYTLDTEQITDEPTAIIDLIRSTPQTPRQRSVPDETLSDVRVKVEKHIKNTYLKKVQAPVGVKPTLKAWMELS